MRLARLTRVCVLGVGLLLGIGCTDTYSGGGCSSASAPNVNIQNSQFCPGNRTVASGATVTWFNLDGINHTSTSDPSSSEVWTSSAIAGGDNFSYQFNTPGTYTYHCSIHPTMTGTITVN